jgi:hypothetical protein
MYDVLLPLARSVRWPVNVWPARRRIVSPGAAASIAAWGSLYEHPLAQTDRVAADAIEPLKTQIDPIRKKTRRFNAHSGKVGGLRERG